MVKCPHCKFGTRYDASIVEDAIDENQMIECVACGKGFKIMVVVPDTRRLSMRTPDQSEQKVACPHNHTVPGANFCLDCKSWFSDAPLSNRSDGG